MNWKRTITAGISAMAISGALLGAGLTSTAHAATPTNLAAAAGEVEVQSSTNFSITNEVKGVTLELAGVYGQTEGHPPIGSTTTYGQWQNFEVKHLASDADVFVTYRVHVDGQGYVGDIQFQLMVPAWGSFGWGFTVNNTPLKLGAAGGPTEVYLHLR